MILIEWLKSNNPGVRVNLSFVYAIGLYYYIYKTTIIIM